MSTRQIWTTSKFSHNAFIIAIVLSQILIIFLPQSIISTVSAAKTSKPSKSNKSKPPKSSKPSAANDPLALTPHGRNIFNLVGGADLFSSSESSFDADADVDAFLDPRHLAGCFCPSTSVVDDCSCTLESVDRFNHAEIQPILSKLVVKPFFRYYKVNINRECPFWSDYSSRCTMRDCGLYECSKDELPPAIRNLQPLEEEASTSKVDVDKERRREAAQSGSEPATCEDLDLLSAVDVDIGQNERQSMQDWERSDEFCVAEDEFFSDAEYIDLVKNPERYTGYRGEPAWKVWRTIYDENCINIFDDGFGQNQPKNKLHSLPNFSNLNEMCMEKRTFYRLISGMHSSINIHLSAQYHFPDGVFRPNLKEFHRRFDADLTHGQGPLWLTNLYFAYLVELRALQKAAVLLKQYHFFTGVESEDAEVQQLIGELTNVIDSFDAHFDESLLFNGMLNHSRRDENETNDTVKSEAGQTSAAARDDVEHAAAKQHAQRLFDEFRAHFQNVSRIMDCVGCDKCRLWGKLQVQGMGTALRILYHDLLSKNGKNENDGESDKKLATMQNLQLRRNEIISLINAFGRLSNSIEHLLTFRSMADSGQKVELPAEKIENSVEQNEKIENSVEQLEKIVKEVESENLAEVEKVSSPPAGQTVKRSENLVFEFFSSSDGDRTFCWTLCAIGVFVIFGVLLCFVGGRRCFCLPSSAAASRRRRGSGEQYRVVEKKE